MVMKSMRCPKAREMRRPKLYEALDFLEQSVEPRWLVRRRIKNALHGDCVDARRSFWPIY